MRNNPEGLVLRGCRPVPLASYLKAVGILRLIGEQKDSAVRGRWEKDAFVLVGSLDRDALCSFFLNDYQPTPILSPWNGGGGFYDPESAVFRMLKSSAPRFQPVREMIRRAQSLLARMNIREKPSSDQKDTLLRRMRAEFPDAFLRWLDAAVLLSEVKPLYPPLLGSGGNDGRLDFSINFVQRLLDLFDAQSGRPQPMAEKWLEAALFREAPFPLLPAPIGQYSPGHVGGPNATAGFDREFLVNPWDYVLMLEGALLFAAAATRRLESAEARALSYPFTVRPSAAGHGGAHPADESSARAEIWMPIWSRPVSLAELEALLSEGRVTLGRRPAADGLDFARAVARLGVDRGIEQFQRFGFLQRSGRAYLAAPLGRIPVSRRPQSRLLDDLDRHGFLDRVRQTARDPNAPGRFQTLAARLQRRLFELSSRSVQRHDVEDVLILLGRLHRVIAAGPSLRDKIPPVPPWNPLWIDQTRDDTDEFELALSLAALSGGIPFLHHLTPVIPEARRSRWSSETNPFYVWTEGDVYRNLGRVLENRMLHLYRKKSRQGTASSPETPASPPGDLLDLPWDSRIPASLASVVRFARGVVRANRLRDLIPALALVDFSGFSLPVPDREAPPLPGGFAVLKLVMTPRHLLKRCGLWSPERRPPAPERVLPRLSAGRLEDAVEAAWRELQLAGIPLPDHPRTPPRWPSGDPRRVLAAMLFPLPSGQIRVLARIVSPPMRTSRPGSVFAPRPESLDQGDEP